MPENLPTKAPLANPPPMPLVFRDAEGWWAILMLIVGRETGMLDAIVRQPLTVAELAARCGVDQRNSAAWLAAMTAHGYLCHDRGKFSMLPSEAAVFRGVAIPFDVMAMLDFSKRAPAILESLVQAIRNGQGVSPAIYHQALGDSVGRINAPLYRAVLLDDWLAKMGLKEPLERGIAVAEIGSGTGDALLELAARCPASSFTGYDLDAAAVRAATQTATGRGLKNVQFRRADAESVSETFDLVLILDAFHHFSQPQAVLQAVAHALRPQGKLVLAETTATGEIDTDAASPFARIVLSANLLYCLQEGLHGNGAGLGATAGANTITSLLKQNGFATVTEYVTGTGYTLFAASTGSGTA